MEEQDIPSLSDSLGRSWGRARKVADLHLPSPPKSPHKIIRVEELEQEEEYLSSFAVRRSKRKTEGFLLRRLLTTLDDSTLGLTIFATGDRGRGIKTSKEFSKGDLLVEYAGDLVSEAEAVAREAEYKADPMKGSYMYFFEHKGKPYCVDATYESGRYGRLVNHSLKYSTARPRFSLSKMSRGSSWWPSMTLRWVRNCSMTMEREMLTPCKPCPG